MSPTAHQPALFEGPGRFPALAYYKPAAADTDANRKKVREAAALLMKAIESSDLDTEHVLVAISAEKALKGHSKAVSTPDIEPKDTGSTSFTFKFDEQDATAVLVQVSAATAEDRIHALRLAREILSKDGLLAIEEEVLSDVRSTYREPFGYPDGRRRPVASDIEQAALSTQNGIAGSSWLFYQRFEQKLGDFFDPAITDEQRNAIMGIDLKGDLHRGPDPSESLSEGHVKHVRDLNRKVDPGGDDDGRPFIIRRGFPYRHPKGIEGLLFLAVSNAPMQFKQILQMMIGTATDKKHDALLKFLKAHKGGLFFVPPDSTWLADGATLPDVSVSGAVASIARPAEQALELYPFTPAGIAYMDRMRNELIFGNPVGRIDRVPNPDDEIASPASVSLQTMTEQIHAKMAGGDDNIDDLLPTLDALLVRINNELGGWKNDAPPIVKGYFDDLASIAAGAPLTEIKVRASAAKLEGAIAAANLSIASGIHEIPALVRDLINSAAQVVAGPTIPDPVIKNELDDLRDEAFDASARVNQGQGYYITITG